MRRMDLDIDALVDSGPAGVRTILTAFNSFVLDHGNLHPHGRIAVARKRNSRSPLCFTWAGVVAPHGTTVATIIGPTMIVEQAGIGRILLDEIVAVATSQSVVAGAPTANIYRGARGAALTAQTSIGSVAVTAVSTPAARAEFRTALAAVELVPGETLSLRCVTTAGADAFDLLHVELWGRIIHTRR